MKKKSSGILVYRVKNNSPEFLLVHPGGPYWKNKDAGTWSIPKGEFENEDPLENARKEFREETGIIICGDFISLNPVQLKSGKKIFAWMIEKNLNPCFIKSNEIKLEWPPHSGQFISVPEVDKAEYFSIEETKKKINVAQFDFVRQCLLKIKGDY